MIIKINDNTFVSLGLVLIYCTTCIPIMLLTPTIFRMGLLALAVVFLVFCLLKNGRFNSIINIFILMLFLSLYFVYVYSYITKPRYYLSNAFISIILIVFSCFLLTDREKYDESGVMNFILIISTITAITTIYGCLRYPYAVRESARALKDTINGAKNQYLAFNITNWSQIYMLSFLVPCIVYLYKKSRKLFLLFIGAILEVAVIISQITFAILLSLLMVFLVSVDVPKTYKQFLKILATTILLLFIFFEAQNILRLIINIVAAWNMEFLVGKLSDLYSLLFLKSVTGDASGRFDLYGISFNTFFKNPVIGVMFSNTSESMFGFHSEFLDLLAFGGIFSVFFELFYISKYIKALRTYQGDDKKNLLVIFGGFLVLFLINPIFSNTALILGAFLMPVLVANYNDKDRSVDTDVNL